MSARLPRLGGLLVALVLTVCADHAPAAAEPVLVAYPATLRQLVNRIAPAFAEASGRILTGRAYAEPRTLPGSGTDVVLTTDVDRLRRGLPENAIAVEVAFAADAMVIAYANDGAFAEAEAADTPWFEALAQKTLRLGRGDPEESALGIRALFALQLAGRRYENPDIPLNVLRPGQTMPPDVLLSRLRAATLDAALLYRSLAIQAAIPLVELPIEINLGDPERAGVYAEASVDLGGEVHRGAPILLTATDLEGGPNPAGGAQLLDFLRSAAGVRILETEGYVIPPDLPAPRSPIAATREAEGPTLNRWGDSRR